MNLKINVCRPSFGVVSRSAIDLAKNNCERDIDKLVDSQKNNEIYNVTTTEPNPETSLRSFCISEYSGRIIGRFNSLTAACIYAYSLERIEKNKNVL